MSLGAGRTAEEIGRAFPGVPVINSSGPKVRATVPDAPAVVIATPGAEPIAAGGYGAALLLDGPAMLGRPDLRAAEETLRRWMAAATLVRPASAGGRVIIGTDASVPVVQALIRWDPEGHAAAELAARRELGFPPAVAMASIEGDEHSVLAAVDRLVVPPAGEILGPVALDDLQDDEFSAPPAKGPVAERLGEQGVGRWIGGSERYGRWPRHVAGGAGRAPTAGAGPGPAGSAQGPERGAARGRRRAFGAKGGRRAQDSGRPARPVLSPARAATTRVYLGARCGSSSRMIAVRGLAPTIRATISPCENRAMVGRPSTW